MGPPGCTKCGPGEPIVALGQTYFAVQTRRQEIADELALTGLPEDQKRLIFRELISTYNTRLAAAARLAGVMEPRDFATFEDHGYMGLYAGRRENDIHQAKKLKPREKILDHMGSEELADNIFRAAQTDAKLRRDQVSSKEQANATHYQVGKEERRGHRASGRYHARGPAHAYKEHSGATARGAGTPRSAAATLAV